MLSDTNYFALKHQSAVKTVAEVCDINTDFCIGPRCWTVCTGAHSVGL